MTKSEQQTEEKKAHDKAWEKAFIAPIAMEMKTRGGAYLALKGVLLFVGNLHGGRGLPLFSRVSFGIKSSPSIKHFNHR